MNLSRISAVIKRHIFLLLRDASKLSELFYWPLFDIILWGFATTWMGSASSCADDNYKLVLSTLSCLVLWQTVYRTSQDICLSFLEEIWSRNLVNLFSTPVTLLEWLVAVMILGCFKVVPSLLFAIAAVQYIYAINIFSLGGIIIPFLLLLIVSGWAIGIFICSFLVYWGHRVQTLVWSLAWAFAPLSGVFFSITVFSKKAQLVSKCLPTTYIFDAVRTLVFTGEVNWYNIKIAIILNIIYLILTLILFKFSFYKSRSLGLSRLEVD